MMNVRCIGEADETKILHDSIYSHGKFRAIEVNIDAVCKEFYALQAVEATMHTQYGRHSHDGGLKISMNTRNLSSPRLRKCSVIT